MGQKTYNDHIELLDSSFSRGSTVGVSFEGAPVSLLESLSELETTLRVGSTNSEVLSDMQNCGFTGEFYSRFQRRVFQDFLEYKNVALDMTLEGFMEEKQFLKYRDDYEESYEEEYSDSADVDESEYLEPEEGADRTSSGGLTESEVTEILNTKWADPYTIPLGKDDDGFDIWTIPDLGIEEDLSEDFSFESLDDEPDIEPEDILFTEPLGVDKDGYDIWGIEEETLADPWGETLSPHFGTDEDGYDLWHDTNNPDSFEVPTEASDGWDHSEDEDRKGLGELKSTWQGTNEDGHDIWVDPDEDGPSIEDVVTEDGTLGILQTSPHGVDADGFDIWEAPVSASEPASATSVVPSPGTVSSPRRTGTARDHYSPLQNSSRSKSSEDKTAEAIAKSADRVGKLGKKFLKFMTR